MIIAEQPVNEAARIDALHSLRILDTPREERFDRLTRLARRLFDVPMAVVTLVDVHRQWFKSCVGLGDATETSRDVSFCAHAILREELTIVPDARLDPRFAGNPQVTGEPFIRFYAGCPIKSESGFTLGTLCLVDTVPRSFDGDEQSLLKDLAAMVEQELAAVKLATIDDLTGVSNRRGFEALARHALASARRIGHAACMLNFDLNHFKQINDRFGHAEGDQALIDFAGLLMTSLRESDVIGRLGGDEFAVFLTNTTLADSDVVLQHLEQTVQAFNLTRQRQYRLDYCVGAVQYVPSQHPDLADLLRDADAAMYGRKKARRSTD
ncbi:sensor domain-containing diguanylate cyclase [Herbaspirillum sp. AP02]|uniref:GGDEF domain-containing protein n=1 Tax=unclassified Herbaspirillum TaxID=2624150 RepID=UPI0015DAB564|nr:MULTISPECIES: sensor domain-containing diguanylate cyclase [unclassified Herbaspirillum]MBG7621437.1 sensor domain-containing diguanylate cyclase [Herbaspirillum sp. AP02]NZD66986.1 sensor domain-containing diguanylate cyclase [Herbaspirillum sp. AP21]